MTKGAKAIPREVKGFLIFVASLFVLLSLLSFVDGDDTQNWLGLLGYVIAWSLMYCFGLGAYILTLFFTWIACKMLLSKNLQGYQLKSIYFTIGLLSLCILLNLLAEQVPVSAEFFVPHIYSETITRHDLGGVPLYHLYTDVPLFNLQRLLSNIGTGIVFGTLFCVSLILFTKWPLMQQVKAVAQRSPSAMGQLWEKITEGCTSLYQCCKNQCCKKKKRCEEFLDIPPVAEIEIPEPLFRPQEATSPTTPKPIQQITRKAPPVTSDLTHYTLPSPSLLSPIPKINQSSLKRDQRIQAQILEETLLSFGIEAKVGEIHCGPTITSFEIQPATGVKVQKITALANDIALNMQAKSIRIIAPIPGKAAVGIEIPSPESHEVSFKELLLAYQKRPTKDRLPLLLGKVVNGSHVTCDLARMPHCIIAGATGSGKSVCINTIVMSIIMNMKPDEVKLLMVDPKKVELTPYSELPHMLTPVITDPADARTALVWLVTEMEVRYEIFKQLGIRNIDGFNQRKINKDLEESLGMPVPKKMHYIVGIIDELADLMMVASSDIETPIARIAQMARAVGIHLILATQRPSREVITGLIKANFPTRISFKVASRVNSQIILDDNGAETLLGNGDMLFLPPGTSNLLRAQGAFIRDQDINQVIEHCCKQAAPNYLIKSFSGMDNSIEGEGSSPSNSTDKLYNEACKTIIDTGNASTTYLQRKLKIGYARAASLMDQLEADGIVSPQEGSKARRVLINRPDETS